jgi:diaminobutyrate-2-oxoglutarate transaminase
MHLDVFAESESAVRYYCRKLPNLLGSARGAHVHDVNGRTFIDFMSACGALNYGHNHSVLKQAAIDYLSSDGIIAGLDFHTAAKLAFIEALQDVILKPRGLLYKLQFPGPTGANCVEAAIKLARKVTGRLPVAAFTNAFHGMSAGALSLTGSKAARQAISPLLGGVVRLPFDGYLGAGIADLKRFEAMVGDPSGGIEPVSAVVVEIIQGEGGLSVASGEWLRELRAITHRMGTLLIVDEIQTGCGRAGTFFAFERSGIVPDIVCLAKSISGLGLPMSLMLLKPEYDVWSPGEHNGTFRGNALAFATATAAIGLWRTGEMSVVTSNSRTLTEWCRRMVQRFGNRVRSKGRGMMQGLEFSDRYQAGAAAAAALERGVLVECCGPHDEVLKIMAPLNIESDVFEEGLDLVGMAIEQILDVASEHLRSALSA